MEKASGMEVEQVFHEELWDEIDFTTMWNSKDSQLYERYKYNTEAWNAVPVLKTTKGAKSGQLVRIIGLLQNELEPESYVKEYKFNNEQTGSVRCESGLYTNYVQCNENEILDLQQPFDTRRVYVCVPVPGANQWTYGKSVTAGEDPQVQEDDVNTDATQAGSEYRELLPVPGKCQGPIVILKTYDSGDIAITSLVECIGYMEVQAFPGADDDSDLVYFKGMPCIHVLKLQQLQHLAPTLPRTLKAHEDIITIMKNASGASDHLLALFTSLLGGDILSAKYLFMNLISRVFIRNSNVVKGSFSLNLNNVQHKWYANVVYEAISDFVPETVYLSGTLQSLNQAILVPKKDYSKEILRAGLLQLGKGSILLLNETEMLPGEIEEQGMKNVKALQTVCKEGAVQYDYTYYNVPMPADITLLVISDGKSMLPCDVCVPLQPEYNIDDVKTKYASSFNRLKRLGAIEECRTFLAAARLCPFNIPDHVAEHIQQCFVEMRRDQNISVSHFDHLLVMCRLLCLSQGFHEMTISSWEETIQMDELRQGRFEMDGNL